MPARAGPVASLHRCRRPTTIDRPGRRCHLQITARDPTIDDDPRLRSQHRRVVVRRGPSALRAVLVASDQNCARWASHIRPTQADHERVQPEGSVCANRSV